MKLIEGLSNQEYHSSAALSSSQLKLALNDPRLFKRAYIDKVTDVSLTSEAVKLGTLFHTMVLEPHEQQPIVYPEQRMDKRTTKYKEWLKEHEDEDPDLLISGDQNGRLQLMFDSLQDYDLPKHGIHLANNINEASLFFTHEDLSLRVRPDSLDKDAAHIIDLKTTSQPVDQHTFFYQIHKLGYDLSAGMYSFALQKYLKKKVRFSWVVVQNKEPYSTVVYHAGLDILNIGIKKFKDSIAKYKLCKDLNEFTMQAGPEVLDRGSAINQGYKELYVDPKKVYNKGNDKKMEIL